MKTRVANGGSTLLDEQIKDAQNSLEYGFCDDVSYNPNIVFYKTETSLPIKMHNQKVSASYGTVMSFLTTYDNPLDLGQMLYDTKRDEYWLCVESYDVAGVCHEGQLGKCMWWLKWQDDIGAIHEMPIIVTSASKYNNGEQKDEVMSIGSDQLMVFVQFNDDTCKLDRGKRFFIDEKRDNPTVYELTRADTALYTFMGKGFMSMILTECAYTASEDDLKYGVCDYIPPATPPESNNETTVLNGEILGSDNLSFGFMRTYTAKLTDNNGNAVEWNDDDFYWNIYPKTIATLDINKNKVNVLANDESIIGQSIRFEIRYRGVLVCSKNVEICEAF
jgi:hypothetical protein